MAYICKLVQGNAILDLSALPYRLNEFVPPSAVEQAIMAEGTSINRRDGERRVGSRARNRALTFTLHLFGSSPAEINGAFDDLQAFLYGAGDDDDPLYLEYRQDYNTPEPLWGQFGTARRLEIVTGVAYKSEFVGSSTLASKAQPACSVELTVRPYALGKRQRLASATGGIFEDYIGTSNGRIRGTLIPGAITNLITNPVFGSTAYSTTGWTIGAGLITASNTDPRFRLFGAFSIKATAIAGAANTLTISVTAANTNAHALSLYAKRPDSSAVSTSQITATYGGSGVNLTFTAVGDGWYRVTNNGSITGVAAARDIVLTIVNTFTLYLDGVQFEEAAAATPLAYGDLLGCAWSGTAHQSTTTRTAARARVPVADVISIGEGTVRIALRWNVPNTFGTSQFLFDTHDADSGVSFRAYFEAADDKIYFADGSSSVLSTALTFAINSIYVFHFVWSTAGLNIYINGALNGTGATYAPPALGDHLYWLTSYAQTYFTQALLLGAATFDRAMTAAQVLADYNNIAELASGGDGYGVRVESMPWVWTKDGDEVVDAYNDATHDDWCVVGGVDGTIQADTIIDLTHASGGVALALNEHTAYIDMTEEFLDLSGTVAAGALGGEVEDGTADTTGCSIPADISGSVSPDTKSLEAYIGKNVYLLGSISDGGANLSVRAVAKWYGGAITYSEYVPIAADGTRKMFLVGPVAAAMRSVDDGDWIDRRSYLDFRYYFKRSTGTNTTSVDYFRILAGIVASVQDNGTPTRFVLRGGKAAGYAWDAGGYWLDYGQPDYQGGILDMFPQRYNHLVAVACDLAANTDTAETTTINRIYVTPRWATA